MQRLYRQGSPTLVGLFGSLLIVVFQRNIPEPFGGILTSLIYMGIVIAAGLLGGWRYGVATTIFTITMAMFFFEPPYFTYDIYSSDFLRLPAYSLIGATLTFICELLRIAWTRIELRQHELEMEVNERRKAQIAERLRADELMTTLASIGDGVIRTDAECRITFMNPVAEQLLGCQSEQAAGQMLTDLFQVVDDATRQPLVTPAKIALSQGNPVSFATQGAHAVLISQDGIERHIDDSAAAIRDASGNVIGSVLVFRDISERLRAQAALLESERRYRAIGESNDYGVWLCNAVGRCTYLSESFLRLVGMTMEECADFGWTKALHPDEEEATIAAWKSCIETGGRWDRENRFKGADGEWHSVLARGVPVRNERGEIISWAGINLDIGRLKQVEQQLRDDDRRKDEFLATLAHELRNPLAPIVNSLHIMKMPNADAEIIQRTREMMERQVHHLVRLVDDLLDVSRVMRGKTELRLEQVEMATVVNRAVEMVQPLINEKHHRLDLSIPSNSLTVNADPVRLAQVIGNLLTNAAKYTDPNGTIDVSVRSDRNQVELTVRDNGIGIAPDMVPYIFDLFVQADHRSTKTQGGLGVGLTLVKTLIEMHGGSVEVNSPGLGQGSEFTIRLPLEPTDPVDHHDVRGTGIETASQPSSLRLLVVDDNQDAAVSLARLLTLEGHEVRIAHSGTDAFEILKTFLPHLLLLDLGMPDMDGYEVASRIRKMPGLENIVIAALTGWGQVEDRRKTSEAGFDYHLMKPLDLHELETILADRHKLYVKH